MLNKHVDINKWIHSIFLPDYSEKFWKNYLYVQNGKSRFRRFICRLRLKKIQERFNCSIPVSNNIHKFTLPHGLSGIFISQGASIGQNCVIFHQVTIGSNTLKDHKMNGAPQIGNNVFIGAGAKIIGNVKIGNGVRIGANCVVVKDVPDNYTVVLQNSRYIPGETERDNSFYHFE